MESGGRKEEETSAAQKGAASLGVSVQEGLKHAKATMQGLVQKATARSEAEADMRVAKAQVEATDEAEAKKKQLTTG